MSSGESCHRQIMSSGKSCHPERSEGSVQLGRPENYIERSREILPLAIDTPVMPTRIKAVVVQCNVALLLLQRLQHSKE